MNTFSALLLGTIQGLAEFLPISSSGHLVLAQSLVPSFSQPGVLFDTALHAGTLLSILIYFRKKILKLSRNDLFLIAYGTMPAVLIGYLFQDFFEGLFTNTKAVGLALLVTGVLNFLTNKYSSSRNKISAKDAGLIGMAQAMAIIPGISRSGSTIFAGSRRGLNKKKAAEFSFLLSVPAVLGANVLQLASHFDGVTQVETKLYILGFVAAFLSGLLAINLVLKALAQRKFSSFGYYCLIVGSLSLLLL